MQTLAKASLVLRAIERVTENVGGGGALESNGSASSASASFSSSEQIVPSMEIEKPFSESTKSSSSDYQTTLHEAPSVFLANGESGDYPPLRTFQDAKTLLYIESNKLWAIATPIAFNILCNYGINSFTSIFVGHIGDVELSAVAISLSVIANLSFGFLLGMASALETLCGQAFGAGELKMLGVYMQRSWIILTTACFCMLPLYTYSKPVLKLLGQRHDIADLAGKFSLYIIPQMFSLAINFPTQKFLQAQSKVAILAWVGFVALILHIFVLFLFVKVFKWGLAGRCSSSLRYICLGIALAQVVYIVGWCEDSWNGLSWLAFKEIWAFVRLSIASAVMLCLEIWYFMSIIVLTGHLEDPVLAVGSLSICVRVSNELGSGHPRAAKYCVFVTVVESLLIGLLSMVLIIATKDHFAILFTNSEQMQKAVSDLAYLLAVTMGIWMGMIFGTFLQTVILLFIVWRTNWNEEVAQASERMRKWGGEGVDLDGKGLTTQHHTAV
ncbi:hypothetical protein DH2020_025624 [Rehmannia glutinosa]|uniref:Protein DETOXIFICATION n=1 Tax=Rehmannia glutinosa TaxID=99300 RepID=A0ABR0W2R9_REHGL